MVGWIRSIFKKKVTISPAEEAYMKGKLKPWDNAHYAIEGGEPITVKMGKVKVPKFTKELARHSGVSIELYIERFLVQCLYMEQGMQISAGNAGFFRLSPEKPEFFTQSQGPKNPRPC